MKEEPCRVPECPVCRLSRKYRITRREEHILCLLTAALSDEAMAISMGCAVGTVRRHVQNIMDKLGMGRREELAVWAVRKGFVKI
jgi:DNA-binding CsgD family transcriptional regulator